MSASETLDSTSFQENVTFWKDRWQEDKIGFHMNKVNPTLVQFLDKLTDGTPKRFFVPLCGKSLDLKYLVDQGHTVFGVEAAEKAIQDLESENSLGLVFDQSESTYSTPDGKLRIFLGDIFSCPFEKFGPFDCVWDRGSFIAFEFKFRPAYKDMMRKALAGKSFRYLLETVEYDRNNFGGPPRAVDVNDIETYYGGWTNFQEVKREPDTGRVSKVPDIGKVDQVIYFLTPKN